MTKEEEIKYSSNILYRWREKHEEFVLSELGNKVDEIELEEIKKHIANFENLPPIVRRIVIDKPEGWEWRLASELMKYYNASFFRRLDDLKNGLYTKSQSFVSKDEIEKWVNVRMVELSKLSSPVPLLLERLNQSFGKPGESGDIREIHHVTILIRDSIKNVIDFEENIYFVNFPEKYDSILQLFKDTLGSQVKKLSSIPEKLDYVVSLIATDHGGTSDKPRKIEERIEFDLPENWGNDIVREMKKLHFDNENSSGCISSVFLFLLFVSFVFLVS